MVSIVSTFSPMYPGTNYLVTLNIYSANEQILMIVLLLEGLQVTGTLSVLFNSSLSAFLQGWWYYLHFMNSCLQQPYSRHNEQDTQGYCKCGAHIQTG